MSRPVSARLRPGNASPGSLPISCAFTVMSKKRSFRGTTGASEAISAFARSPAGYHPLACVEHMDRVAVPELER